MRFITKTFSQLTKEELYAILRLRAEVFAVEQNCVYQDIDNLDQKALHVIGGAGQNILAYARILHPGLYYKEASIGRIVTQRKVRMEGHGKALMQYAILETNKLFKGNIRIMAQCYLSKFYKDFKFTQVGDEFLEDGIPHIEMVLKRTV